MLFRNPDASVPERDRNLFERDARKQQVHRERVPKTVRVPALDASRFEDFSQGAPPVPRYGVPVAFPVQKKYRSLIGAIESSASTTNGGSTTKTGSFVFCM